MPPLWSLPHNRFGYPHIETDGSSIILPNREQPRAAVEIEPQGTIRR
jgi:hypothetical protein